MKTLEETIRPFISTILIAAIVISAVGWGLWKSRNTGTGHVSYLQITTTAPPAGKSQLPEQRRIFALDFGRKFRDKDATATTTGDFHMTILIRGSMVDETLVHGMKEDGGMMQTLREMGFKHLVMTDGKVSWDVDLKN
jgi:hypothetical protein